MSLFIHKDEVHSTYSTIQKELRPALSHLEETWTGGLSQQRCDGVLKFLRTHQAPFVFISILGGQAR